MTGHLRAAVSALAVCGLASSVYQILGERRDARRYPPPGELVDIDGRRLHLCRAGEGTPSVIIVPCLGGPGVEWWHVQRELARYTGVYTYDRAGLGWSDPGPWPRTYPRMADELYQLLTAAAVPAPYLLVGHSTGGIIVRRFAARHPEGLVGVVLIDSSHEDQHRRLARVGRGQRRIDLWRRSARHRLTPFGLIRLGQDLGIRERRADPGDVMALTSRQRRADIQEMICHALTPPGSEPPNLGAIPLLVVTAGAQARGTWEHAWQEMQAELAGLSTCSTHIVADRAGHHINRDDPGFLVRAIHDMIDKLR